MAEMDEGVPGEEGIEEIKFEEKKAAVAPTKNKFTGTTLAELREYSESRFTISDQVEEVEVGNRISPYDYIDKWKAVEHEIRRLSHLSEEAWRAAQEARQAKLAEIDRMYKIKPSLFFSLKEYDSQEYQAWVDYGAANEMILDLLTMRGAICYNTYHTEHSTEEGVSEADKEAVRKALREIVRIGRRDKEFEKEMHNFIFDETEHQITEERQVSLNREESRVKEIENENLNYIRKHRDDNGEVKWSELRNEVGGKFTIPEWEKIIKHQKGIDIRREKHGTKWWRLVYETDVTGQKVLGEIHVGEKQPGRRE